MMFAWPFLLWLLLAPAAWLAWELQHRRSATAAVHPHIVRAEAGIGRLNLDPAAPATARRSSRRPRVCLCFGLACGIVALARPQWGRIDEPVFEQSREIVIALDLSRSMQTPDVKPTRLDRAKLLVQSLLDKLAGERVGLVSFAGTAFLQAPLSADYEVLREFLPSLAPGFMPVGGTDYGALIDAAADAFSSGATADRFLIILSDGGATDDTWRQHIAKLKEKGVRVIGLGVGTAAGGLIPDGAGAYVKDDSGAVVMSKLESDTLRELSRLTGGVYRDASEWIDLPRLLSATVAAGRRGRFTEKNTARYAERFQWALAPALLLLLLSYYREFPVRPKSRDIELAGRDDQPAPPGVGVAAAILLGLLGLASWTSAAFAAAEPVAAPPGALLGRIVGRLSTEEAPSALDWLELGRQTLSWGQQLQSSRQPVPPGPVQDALAAVDVGSAADPKVADWPQLRGSLKALLKNQDQQKQKQQDQQQKQQQKQDQKDQSQQSKQSQQGKSDQKSQQNEQDQQSSPGQQGQSQQNQSQAQSASPPSSGNPPASAFGQMKPPGANPPPPSGGTQQVGGTSQERPDPANADPALAPLLQKLAEVRDRDSPAQLYQMFEKNEPRPPEKKGKDW